MAKKRKRTHTDVRGSEDELASPSAFATVAALFLERHGFLLPCSQRKTVESDGLGLASGKAKVFLCRMGVGRLCKSMKFKEFGSVKCAIMASISFWGQNGRTDPPSIGLFKLPWVPRVDNCRVKVLQLMIRTKQPPEKIARYIISQHTNKITLESPSRIPYLDFVRAYAQQVPAFQRELFQHVVQNVEKKASEHVVSCCDCDSPMLQKSCMASKALWLEGREVNQEAMLCHHKLDCEAATEYRNEIFDKLDFCDKVRFAASQVVAYHVLNWYQLIDSNYLLSFVAYVPKSQGTPPFFLTKSIFQMLKSRLAEDNGSSETCGIPLDIMCKSNECIGVCNLRADSYEDCICFRNNNFYQVECLFRENLNMPEFKKSVLSCVKNKPVTLALSLEIQVKLACIKNQYIIASILTIRKIQLPKDFSVERVRSSADGNSNFWSYRQYVRKVILYVRGKYQRCAVSLASIISLYQNYPIFCVLDVDKPQGKMMVHKSRGYEARFGDIHKTRPLCHEGLSLGFICNLFVKPILQGKAPTVDMCLQDQYGVNFNCTIRFVLSNNFQYVTVVFIEKTFYSLPEDVSKDYEDMEKNDPNNKLRAIQWSWRASKVLYQTLRSSGDNTTVEQISKRYPSDSMYMLVDVCGESFYSSFHYSPNFKKHFCDIRFLLMHCEQPKSVKNAHHVILNTVLQPLWKGDVPKIIRRVQCRDGIFRWFQMTVSRTTAPQWVIVLLEESDVPFSGDDVPFGCPDIRPNLHLAARHLLNTKTEAHDGYSCTKFLGWMTKQFGQEGECMYIIIDRHIKDAFEACVYRSKKHIDRYGDYKMLYSLIEQRTFSLCDVMRYMSMVKLKDRYRLLTFDRKYVDDVETTTWFGERYTGICIRILASRLYRSAKEMGFFEWMKEKIFG